MDCRRLRRRGMCLEARRWCWPQQPRCRPCLHGHSLPSWRQGCFLMRRLRRHSSELLSSMFWRPTCQLTARDLHDSKQSSFDCHLARYVWCTSCCVCALRGSDHAEAQHFASGIVAAALAQRGSSLVAELRGLPSIARISAVKGMLEAVGSARFAKSAQVAAMCMSSCTGLKSCLMPFRIFIELEYAHLAAWDDVGCIAAVLEKAAICARCDCSHLAICSTPYAAIAGDAVDS